MLLLYVFFDTPPKETKMAATQQMQAPLLLTARDVQRELQIGRDRAHRMMADGTLPVIKIGQRRRYVARAALEQWIALQTGRSVS